MTRPTSDLVLDRAVRERAGPAGAAPSVPAGRRPRIAMVSTFPPTQCGLATFAQALAGGFDDVGADVDVVRVVGAERARIRGVAANWVTDPAATPWPADPAGSAATARVLNGYDVVILQHEYGIYGGPDGEHVLGLMSRLDVPVVSVLHTVLGRPTSRQHRILSQVIRESAAVVTMTRTARDRAVHTYGAAAARVAVVPHGAAEALVAPRAPAPPPRSGSGAPVVLTWGLLGRGKGIEWGIRAMATLADLHPAPVYVVAGRTHPRLPTRTARATATSSSASRATSASRRPSSSTTATSTPRRCTRSSAAPTSSCSPTTRSSRSPPASSPRRSPPASRSSPPASRMPSSCSATAPGCWSSVPTRPASRPRCAGVLTDAELAQDMAHKAQRPGAPA